MSVQATRKDAFEDRAAKFFVLLILWAIESYACWYCYVEGGRSAFRSTDHFWVTATMDMALVLSLTMATISFFISNIKKKEMIQSMAIVPVMVWFFAKAVPYTFA